MLARDDGEVGDDRLAVEGELAERLGVHAHDRGGARLAAARLLAQPRAAALRHGAPRGPGRRGPRHREAGDRGAGEEDLGFRRGEVARVWGCRDGEREAEACGSRAKWEESRQETDLFVIVTARISFPRCFFLFFSPEYSQLLYGFKNFVLNRAADYILKKSSDWFQNLILSST